MDLSVDGAFEATNLGGKFKSNCAGSEMTLTAKAGKVFLSSPSDAVGSVNGSGTAAAVSIDDANVQFSYAKGGALRASIEGVTDVRSLGVGTFHDSKREAQISGSFSLERGDFKLGGVRGVLPFALSQKSERGELSLKGHLEFTYPCFRGQTIVGDGMLNAHVGTDFKVEDVKVSGKRGSIHTATDRARSIN